jgi:site-specific DNA-methyltransferase (adenine-specific)
MSTHKSDLVLDPFGGSGTTYYASEMNERYWVGIEIEDCSSIVDRLSNSSVIPHVNNDYIEIA